jgi:membrane-anchored protein YejM (alkaline phosphatase superfamily)
MDSASIKDIRQELKEQDEARLQEICLRLAKYKKENKELLAYLLFASGDEAAYVSKVKAEIESQFESLPIGNVYYIKKSLRKILRIVNRHTKYSEETATELEVRIHFCKLVKSHQIPLQRNVVLSNLYQQQIKKINSLLSKLDEDLRGDFDIEGL